MASKRRTTTQHPSSARSPSDSLGEYEAKRDFSSTPEPPPRVRAKAAKPGAKATGKSSHSRSPKEKKAADGALPEVTPQLPAHEEKSGSLGGGGESQHTERAPIFVVQKHDARRLHYDVRLQLGDVLVSWAVPKGPSYDPTVKRLAVHVEDHPVDYAGFEGRIPEGHYGAGDVLVWDRGTFELASPGFDLPGMLAKGHVHVTLHGTKLRGGWHFVRTRDEKTWLFFKADDAFASKTFDVLTDEPASVVTGHVLTRPPQRKGAAPSAGHNPSNARTLASRLGSVARAISSRLMGAPSDYRYEIKYDGYRILAIKSGSDVVLVTRNGNDWTARFIEIARAVAQLPVGEVVLDGEACVVDGSGQPSFEALQASLSGDRHAGRLVFPTFDLLWLEGRDLRAFPLEERRRTLETLLRSPPPPLSFSTSIEGDLASVIEAARSAGLEGLVAKRKGSPYTPGPSQNWIKIKFELRQDCVVCGYTPMSGTHVVGALILGLYDEGGKFIYAGRVGTGMSDAVRAELARRLEALRSDRCPFAVNPRIPDARWTPSDIVIEIGLREWTRDGNPRFPRFLGFRDDKDPRECLRESTDSFVDMTKAPRGKKPQRDALHAHEDPRAGESAADAAPAAPPSARKLGPRERIGGSPSPLVAISNPDKIIFPKDGISKRDIVEFYTAIATYMLPHLAGRPINMQRWPNGIHDKEWFQHNAPPKMPPFVRQLPFDRDAESAVEKNARQKWRVVVENVETLQYLANLAALTLHQRSAHIPSSAVTEDNIAKALATPDYLVIDLDPGDGPFEDLIRIALAARKLFDALALESLVKTSGKRGLHVFVPLAPVHTHEEVAAFAIEIARAIAKVLPDIATTETRIDRRGGRLYVDAGQNGRGRTVVSPYSLRAVDGACVSTPIEWAEVDPKLRLQDFTLKTLRRRLDARGDLLAGLLRGKGRLPRSERSPR